MYDWCSHYYYALAMIHIAVKMLSTFWNLLAYIEIYKYIFYTLNFEVIIEVNNNCFKILIYLGGIIKP